MGDFIVPLLYVISIVFLCHPRFLKHNFLFVLPAAAAIIRFPPVLSTSLSLVVLLRSCVTILIPRLLPRSSQRSLLSSPAFDLLVLPFCYCGVEIFTVAGWVRLLEQASDLGAVDRQVGSSASYHNVLSQ
jgi:hypothetical protein